MKSLAAAFIFYSTFFVVLTACGLLHVHGWVGMAFSIASAGSAVWLGRPFWLRLFRPVNRPPKSFRDPRFGNRAARREQQKRHQRR